MPIQNSEDYMDDFEKTEVDYPEDLLLAEDSGTLLADEAYGLALTSDGCGVLRHPFGHGPDQ